MDKLHYQAQSNIMDNSMENTMYSNNTGSQMTHGQSNGANSQQTLAAPGSTSSFISPTIAKIK